MARLTKHQRAALMEEKQAFDRVAALAAQQGYTLHRMIGLQPYCVRRPDSFEEAFSGDLAAIEAWLKA